MKILLVCQYYSPEPFRVTSLAEELAKRGHDITVLAGIPNYPEGKFYDGYGFAKRRRETLHGVEVKRVALIPRGKGKAVGLALNYASFIVSGTISAFGVRRGEFDAVLVYQLSPVTMALPAIVAARRARAPLVLYVADLWPESLSAAGGTHNQWVINAVGRLVDTIYRACAKILVTSHGFIGPIVARGQDRAKVEFLPQYPEDVYALAEVSASDAAKAEVPPGFTIAFTGNLGASQGLEIVIEAADLLRAHSDIHWLIIGDGRSRAGLEDMVKEKKLAGQVLFLGRKPMEKISTYLALSDAALLCLKPEPLFALTLPAKIQSYFACGIPVIGSVDGDAAQVIREAGAGLVGPGGDAQALADNVLSLYECTAQQRKKYSQNALAYFAEHFRKDKLVARLEASIIETIGRHNSNGQDS